MRISRCSSFTSAMIHRFRQFTLSILLAVGVGSGNQCTAREWRSVGPWGGSVTSITSYRHSPQLLLASGRGCLLYVLKQGAEEWSLLPFPRETFCEIAATQVDPSDPLHYLVGVTGGSKSGLWESWDAGNSWAPNAAFTSVSVRALATSSSNPAEIVAGSSHGVFFSVDSGRQWRCISDPRNAQLLGITAIAIDPRDPTTIYAGTPHLAWKTTNLGKTWISISDGMIDDSDIFSISVYPGLPGYVIASACSGMYKSFDGGNTWHKITGIANTYRRTHIVSQDPRQISTIYAGTTLGLLRSTDGGATWHQITGVQVNSLTFDAGTRLYVASEDGIWTSEDHGEKLDRVNRGFVARAIRSVAELSGNRLFAMDSEGGNGTAIFCSDDGGQVWRRIETSGLDEVHLAGIAGVADILVGWDTRRIYLSDDGGQNWTIVGTGSRLFQDELESTRIWQSQIIIRNGAPLILVATDRGLFESGDLGKRWKEVVLGLPAEISNIYFSTPKRRRIMLRSAGALYLSNDSGQTWERLTVPVDVSEINDVAIPDSKDMPILIATKKGLLESHNEDSAWVFHSGDLPLSTVTSVLYDPSQAARVYALQFGSVFESSDAGNSWTMLSNAQSSVRKLWKPTGFPGRMLGLTNELGIVLGVGF